MATDATPTVDRMSYGDVQSHAQQAKKLAEEASRGFGHDQGEQATLARAVGELAAAVYELAGQLRRDN